MTRCTLLPGVLLFLLPALVSADLFAYLAKPDDSFAWELKGVAEKPEGKVYDLRMTSQVWQGIKWEHQVQVYEPPKIEFPDVLGLYITGGGADEGDQALGLTLAGLSGCRLATLYHIPNQPLFDGLTEDALISYTWVKYLDTGDEEWPLLFPMVKSAVRAMDCLDRLAQEQWGAAPRGYIALGASKRGWTTYLTGIAAPERVIGIAPMVFDILNMPIQIEHQRDFWGDYSPQISDYTEKGLHNMGGSERGFRLSWIMDPYSYRDRLLMPKLIVLGSNDPYWPTDAVNLYYPALPNPKGLLIAPNSGHGLNDRLRLVGSVTAFFRLVAKKEALPRVTWEWDETPEGLALRIDPGPDGPKPAQSRVWTARNSIRDFRPAKWEEAPLPLEGEEFVAKIARAEGQFTAAYGELMFDVDGRLLTLSTQPRVISPIAR